MRSAPEWSFNRSSGSGCAFAERGSSICSRCDAEVEVRLVTRCGPVPGLPVEFTADRVVLAWTTSPPRLSVGERVTLSLSVSDPRALLRVRARLDDRVERGDDTFFVFCWEEPKLVYDALPRRGQQRVNRRNAVRVDPIGDRPAVQLSMGAAQHHADLADISMSGIGVWTRPSCRFVVREGDPLAVRLCLPNQRAMDLITRVRSAAEIDGRLRLGCHYDALVTPDFTALERRLDAFVMTAQRRILRDRAEGETTNTSTTTSAVRAVLQGGVPVRASVQYVPGRRRRGRRDR